MAAAPDNAALRSRVTRTLVESNQGLVHNIARKFVNHGIPFEDLVQEGNIGLMRAIELFDVTRDTQFSTYATTWVRQAVLRCIADASRTVRVPTHVHDRMIKMNRLSRDAQDNAGLAAAMSMSDPELMSLQVAAMSAVSLDTAIGSDDGAFTLIDTLADEHTHTPHDAYERTNLGDTLNTLLSGLKQREAKILALRYGLGGCEEHTLDDLANLFEISRERVRQIEAAALDKLGRGSRGALLREFLKT
jgi:RNA polymerase primary sigma factor